MTDFFQWLSGGSVSAIVFITVITVLVVTIVIIYAVAFFQGREVSFWPPKIGEKPAFQKQSDVKKISQRPEPRTDKSGEIDKNRATVVLANRTHMPKLWDIITLAHKEIILYAVQHTTLRHYAEWGK